MQDLDKLKGNNIDAVDKTAVVIHGDLISFLRTNASPMVHTHKSPNNMLSSSQIEYLTQKGFYNPKEHLEKDALRFEHPIILHSLVVLTNQCNQNCAYCYTEANEHPDEPEILGQQWIDIFDNIKIPGSKRIQNISLTGGEPTMHPDFAEILKHLSDKYKLELSTNGLELSNEIINGLRDFDGLMSVSLSFDSYKLKEDELMRGTGTYAPRMKNLALLCGQELPIYVGMVVHGRTVDSLKETTQFFLDNFPQIKFKYIPISKMGRARYLDKSFFLTEEKAAKYVEDVLAMKSIYGNRILSDPTSSKDSGEDLGFHWSGRCSHMKYESERTLYRVLSNCDSIQSEMCNAGYGTVSISPSGSLRPCLRADSFFEEILTGTVRKEIIPSLVGLKFEEIGKLPYWGNVKLKSHCFNPLLTCALKKGIGRKNEYK